MLSTVEGKMTHEVTEILLSDTHQLIFFLASLMLQES